MSIRIIIVLAGLRPFNFFPGAQWHGCRIKMASILYGRRIIDVVLNSAGTIPGGVIFQIFTQNPIPHRMRR
jgi:hypothetical protein